MTTANDICAVCEQHPEDILMLECTHDLCVGCAAEIFSKANRKSSVFVCEICLAQTVLDRETVECLESAVKEIRKQTPKHTHNRSNNMPVASNNTEPCRLPAPDPPKTTTQTAVPVAQIAPAILLLRLQNRRHLRVVHPHLTPPQPPSQHLQESRQPNH
jgi:hypothetical protein